MATHGHEDTSARGVLVLFVLAMAVPWPAHGATGSPPARRAAKLEAGHEQAKQSQQSKREAWALQDGTPFLDALERCQDDGTQQVDLHAQRLLGTLEPGVSLRAFIASVPDPNQTSFGAAFDATLASIRAAFSALGYASGGYFLPWHDADSTAEGGKSTPDDEGRAGSGAADGANEGRSRRTSPSSRCMPGILVFRKSMPPGRAAEPAVVTTASSSGDRGDVAFVLLVGETPTSGVLPNALDQALTFARRLDAIHPIAILGPTFSGSAPSLRLLLDRWTARVTTPAMQGTSAPLAEGTHPDGAAGAGQAVEGGDAPRFEIVSGTATSPGVARELTSARRHFSATVVPDNVQTCAMYRFLEQRLGIPMSDVAVMIEANTTFGAFFRDFTCNGLDGKPLRPRVMVPFPLHVSDLRSAEERRRRASQADGSQDVPASGIVPGDPLLDVRVDQRARRMDSLPALTPNITAAETQLDLVERLVTLCRENIQALGILASDVRDVTVLGEEAKRRCPRVQLFTLGPDRILYHSRYRDLDGLLVASTYPLHAGTASWTYPFRGREVVDSFPSENAQGVFNAALLLAGDAGALLDYGPPLVVPGAETRPAVWIAATGGDGFWPVQAAGYGDADHAFVHPAPSREPAAAQRASEGWHHRFSLPEGFVFLMVVLLVFAALNLVAFIRQSNPLAPPSRRRSVWSWLDAYRPVEAPFLRARVAVVACAFLVLALMNGGAAILFAIPGYLGGDIAMRAGAVAASYSVGLLLAGMACVLGLSSPWTVRQGVAVLRGRFLIAFAGGGLVLGSVVLGVLPSVSRALASYEPDLTLFFKRTTNVTSGFSATAGALLYALTLFAAASTELGRIRLLDFERRFRATCFSLTTAVHPHGALGRAARTGARGVFAVATAALLGALVTGRDYHHPFEGRWLGYLFCLAGPYVVAAMILFQLFRLARTWLVIRRAFQEYMENHNLPPFRKLLRPFFLRLVGGPLDPTLIKIVSDHCTQVASLPANEPHREAVRLALLASYGRAHLHNFLTFVTAAGFMLILLSTSYPFKLLHSADTLTWLVVLAIVLTALLVLLDMNRNEVLSRIAGTAPGRISLDRGFFRTVLVHIGLPLLGLAATRFTTVGVLFGGFIKPLMQLFGGIGAD